MPEGFTGLVPGHLDLVPAGQGACGGQNARLPRVIAGRLSLALEFHELAQDQEELAVQVFQTDGHVGGAIDFLLKQAEVRGTQRFVRLAQHPAQHTRRRPADLLEHASQVEFGQPEGERVGGGRFEMMGLVHDQVIVGGQHVAAGGDVGQQQGVVDDQHVRRYGGLARLVERAGSAGGLDTGFAAAGIIFSRHARPHLALGRAGQVDLVAVARLVLEQPDQHLGQHAHFVARWSGNAGAYIAGGAGTGS